MPKTSVTLVAYMAVLLVTAGCGNAPMHPQFEGRVVSHVDEYGSGTGGAEDGWDLSEDAFIEEMLYPQGLARTPRFNAYTPDSYHVRKLHLVDSVSARNTNTVRKVETLIILGPAGPLRQYNIVTIISTNPASENVRMNHLVFPHERITHKSTRLLPREEMNRIVQGLLAHPTLREIRTEDHAEDAEWDLAAIVAAFGDSPTTRALPKAAMTNDAMSVENFYEAVNDLLGGDLATTTYSTVPED